MFSSNTGFSAPPAAQPPSSTGLNVDFDSVFGNKSAAGTVDSAGKRFAETDRFSPHVTLEIHLTAAGHRVSWDPTALWSHCGFGSCVELAVKRHFFVFRRQNVNY